MNDLVRPLLRLEPVGIEELRPTLSTLAATSDLEEDSSDGGNGA